MKKFHLPGFLVVFAVFFFSTFLVEVVSATPSAPIEHTLSQPDGSTLIARQWGDEWSNGFETLEGYTIIKDEQDRWVFAQLIDGQLTPYTLLTRLS
jgi:hypothetical protein